MMKYDSILELNNISLKYGRLQAIENLNLTLKKGTIHALLGEHGAGKSSIAHIICGLIRPYSGSISTTKNMYPYLTPKTALKNGIRMVHQNFSMNRYFTIAENLFYSDETLPFFSWNYRGKLIDKAQAFVEQYGFDLDVRRKTNSLNLSEQTIVEILSNIRVRPEIFILDESIDKLSSGAAALIIDVLRDLRDKGSMIFIITHNMDGIYELADRITIIRNGQNIITDDIEHINKIQMIKIAYTQMAEVDISRDQFKAFYELLKYNEAILINLPVNLVVIDTRHEIKLLNNFFKKCFSIEKEQFIGDSLNNLLNGTSTEIFRQLDMAVDEFRENQFYQIELLINGRKGIFNIRLFPVDDDGFHIGTIIILEDITEYDDLQKNNLLTEKLSTIGLLAAGVAHEINNPLEIIYSYLTNMKFKFKSNEINGIVGKLQTELNYITQIVSNLQNFSETDKVVYEETDVNEIINELIKLLQLNARLKNIEINFIPETNDKLVLINRNEFKQVLLNLFKNSFEAMPDGGTISIYTSLVSHDSTDMLKILFQDTGPGISEEKNLFIPFYSTKNGKNQNTGLGLSLVYSIVKKYQGTISLKNRSSGGCSVIITFPVI